MMRRIDAAPAHGGDRPPGPAAPAARSTPGYLWWISQLLPPRPQDHGDDRSGGRRPGVERHRPRLLGACRVSPTGGTTAPGRPGTPGRRDALRRHDRRPRCSTASSPSKTTTTAAPVKRFSATLVNHLFLLYFDTRAGYGNTVRIPCPAIPGVTLLVRDFYRLGRGASPGPSVAAGVPYHHLTTALVLEGVDFTVTDFGTSNHIPAGLPRPPRRLRPLHDRRHSRPARLRLVPTGELRRDRRRGAQEPVPSTTGTSRRWSGDEKIRAGAYVYFTFLRPLRRGGRHRGPARLDRAARPARTALRAHVGHAGREHRHPRRRGPTTSPIPGLRTTPTQPRRALARPV